MPLHVSKICFVYKRLVSMYHGIGKFIYSFLMQSHSLTNRTECFWSNNGVFLLFFLKIYSYCFDDQASPQREVGSADWPSLWEQVPLLRNIRYGLVYCIPQ